MQLNLLEVGLGGGFVLQIANRDHGQMMSYLIETPDQKTVMIDGGRLEGGDARYLYELLKKRGGKVDLWLMTHAHDDHFGALSWLLKNEKDLDLTIADLRFSFPPVEWLQTAENGDFYHQTVEFLRSLDGHGIVPKALKAGETLTCGAVIIDVLSDGTGYERYQSINDTTAVLRVHFPKRDVLFLGDLGLQGGRDLLKTCPAEQLRCDIVQMAHHGQNGVDRDFYAVVQPKICLYCAPDWLWENDLGNGFDSGPFQTVRVREWMEELGVQVSCPHAYGDYQLV